MTALTVAIKATSNADVESLAEIGELANKFSSPEMRDAFNKICGALSSGNSVIVAAEDDLVTTTQAAKVLGVSRAHLYKVLDSGALPFTIVGAKDRRITMADLRNYAVKVEEARRHAALVAAHPRSVHAAAIDEM